MCRAVTTDPTAAALAVNGQHTIIVELPPLAWIKFEIQLIIHNPRRSDRRVHPTADDVAAGRAVFANLLDDVFTN